MFLCVVLKRIIMIILNFYQCKVMSSTGVGILSHYILVSYHYN